MDNERILCHRCNRRHPPDHFIGKSGCVVKNCKTCREKATIRATASRKRLTGEQKKYQRGYQAEYRKKNREKINKYQREYQKEHLTNQRGAVNPVLIPRIIHDTYTATDLMLLSPTKLNRAITQIINGDRQLTENRQ